MNSTNLKLEFEKKKIYEFALSLEGNYKFPEIDSNADSYFTNYENAKHLETPLSVYDSSEISDFRKNILELWKLDDDAKKFSPAIFAAYNKSKTETVNALPTVDLYNYMM